ncbi:MAG: hypothetical protein R3Y32_00180 [Bacillota bacterium]
MNLFWSVYKNLEKEVLKLADNIHFSDKQLNVYSMKIADLIVRCAIEIEAISKALYSMNGGVAKFNDKGKEINLYFDTDCIDYLENKWHLSKKKIIIAAANFYFEKEDSRILTPLKKANKQGNSGSKWKQAYQSLKHDRQNSLEKGNVQNLIAALGALYILNIYYKDDSIKLVKHEDINTRQGSDVFEVICFDATRVTQSNIADSEIRDLDKLSEAILIKKYQTKSIQTLEKEFKDFNDKLNNEIIKSPQYADEINKDPEKYINSTNAYNNRMELFKSIQSTEYFHGLVSKIGVAKIVSTSQNAKVDICCNKHEVIYK